MRDRGLVESRSQEREGAMFRVVRFTVCALAILLSQAPKLAAKVVHANCGSAKINDALQKLDPAESNTIRVSGTCDEFVNITDFAQLTITGASKGSEIASIHGTSAGSLLWIVRSHVQINNLLLDGGQWGVMCQDFSVCAFTGNTIVNASLTGVQLENSGATFNGDVIQNNTNNGIVLYASHARVTDVRITGTIAGPGSYGSGFWMNNGSSAIVQKLTVDGNAGNGIYMEGGSTLNYQSWMGPFSVTNNGSGGIWVTANSSASLGGVTVTGNHIGPNGEGSGVVVTGNASASFWGGATITGNDPIDLYCSVNGITPGVTGAVVGNTNCADPYQ